MLTIPIEKDRRRFMEPARFHRPRHCCYVAAGSSRSGAFAATMMYGNASFDVVTEDYPTAARCSVNFIAGRGGTAGDRVAVRSAMRGSGCFAL